MGVLVAMIDRVGSGPADTPPRGVTVNRAERSPSGHAPYRSASRPGSITVTLRWFRLDVGVLILIVFCAVRDLFSAGMCALVPWTPGPAVLVPLSSSPGTLIRRTGR